MPQTVEDHQTTRTRIPQRWVIAFLGFCCILTAFGMRVCLSIAITKMSSPPNNTGTVSSDETCTVNYYSNTTKSDYVNHSNIEEYDWNERTQGLILSSFYLGYIITSILGGIVCQKLGGKKTLSLGILSSSLFTILIPFGVKYGGATALIILRITTGFGQGLLYPAINHLLAHWIPRDELSKAVTIVFSGSPLGIIFGMLVSGLMLEDSEIGWPLVFYLYGGIGLISYALVAAFCYNEPIENPSISKEELKYLESKMKNTHKCVPPTPWRHILTSPAVWASISMKFGNTWICMTAVSDIPKYMSSVLKFSAQENGFSSSLPFLSAWLGGILTSCLADKIIANGIMSVTSVRKLGCTISAIGPGVLLVAASYIGCGGLHVVALQTTGLFLNGFSFPSVLVNVLDLSPNYASSIEGLGDAISIVSGVLAPYAVGVVTPNQTLSEWRSVFWLVFAIAGICNAIYLFFGSGEVQKWNHPAYLRGNTILDERGAEKDVYLLPMNKQ